MPAIRVGIIGLLGLICFSCIEPFDPEIEDSQQQLVISGMISDAPGRHTVTISRSSSYRWPEFQPVEFCVVTVSNQDGEIIHYSDEGDGIYAADVPEEFLEVGDAASLFVVTSYGREYRSEFDTILPCPEIDSVYWEFQYEETEDPEWNIPGIQFYLDMAGKPTDSRNMIWRLEESWEYWAALFGTHRWWGFGQRLEEFRSNPLFKCWYEFPVHKVYEGTTRNLSNNELKRVELHHVSNKTDRLSVSYSLLVQQQSLSVVAYEYWQRQNEQSIGSGGLYETIPTQIQGNITSVFDEEEVVLGYFYASQVRKKRIFVHNNNFFDFPIPHIECEYQPFSVIWEWDDIDWPVYIYRPGPFQPVYTAESYCFDCRLQGGNNERPEYWESWK